MTDAPKANTPANEKESLKSQLIFIAITALVLFYLLSDLQRFKNIAIVLIGFAAVIFIHELGHFIAAKSVGILVEAFSLGFGPVVLGVQKVKGGFLIRILPTIIKGKNGNGKYSFTIPVASAKQGETEYRISLVPLGGFVKMLGQEDVAADKPSDNPRAYPNRPIWARSIVIAAGVTMNVIFGAVVFVLVFAHGVPLPPAVVGDVVPNSPAAQAGILPGDEVIAIGDKNEHLGFKDIMLEAVFADPCQPVAITVRHLNNTTETIGVTPIMNEELGTQAFGIMPPTTLTIAPIQSPTDQLQQDFDRLGIQAGDTITAVNGQPVEHAYQYARKVSPALNTSSSAVVTVTLKRKDNPGETYDVSVPMDFYVFGGENPGSLLGIAIPLQIRQVVDGSPAAQAGFEPGDIVTRVGEIEYPNAAEFSKYCQARPNQTFIVAVQRAAEDGTAAQQLLEVTPRLPEQTIMQSIFSNSPPPRIGVVLGYNYQTTTINRTYQQNKTTQTLADIPVNAVITAVNDQPINNFEQLAIQLNQLRGQTAQINYTTADQPQAAESIAIEVPESNEQFAFIYMADFGTLPELPLVPLERIYQGKSFAECLKLGFKTTYGWIAQNYMFIKGMFTSQVSPTAASGPVGILKMSYTIASQKTLIFYCYFMAIISIALAVFNFLPLPILDGGHFVMLMIEKIKGSPVPIKIQEIVTYLGLALILGFALFVTYHDIVKWVNDKI